MARSRSFPVGLLEDPDYFELSSETQAVLVGLVLAADDEGRGRAHTGLLARKFNKEMSVIETALAALSERGLLQIYQGGRHHYYVLCQWGEWQTLSKPTPSRYPAPPNQMPQPPQGYSEFLQLPQGFSGEVGEIRSESEGEEEQEQKKKRREDEDERDRSNVVHFPITTTGANNSGAGIAFSRSSASEETMTTQVASTLKLAFSADLSQIVREFAPDASLSLLGEAIEAREYIDDPARNQKGQLMSPGFFRRWLKRTQQQRAGEPFPRAGTASSPSRGPASRPSTPETVGPVDQYRAYVQHLERYYAAPSRLAVASRRV